MPELDSPKGVLAVGTLVGSYELISVLGQGGFGITYLARDTGLGRKVALKEYLPASLAIREADTTVVPRSTAMAEEFVWGRDRFIDEARTLATLGGVSSIVPVYDFLEANGTAYMVMAFAEGETLSHRLKDGRPMSPADVDRLLYPLMEGLERVHEAGFVHRDIKPDNIILDANGGPTLIDFGASRAPVAGRTGAMTAIFTPGYAAAEQFSSGKQGPWTDIYGLSATLYHAIAGRTPPSAFDRMLDDEYVSLVEMRPNGFPLATLAAIDAGMAVRTGGRPQSIAAWRELFAEGAAASDQTIVLPRGQRDADQTVVLPRSQRDSDQTIVSPRPAVEAAPAESPPWRKRLGGRLTLTLASAAIVLVLGSAGYFLWSPASRPAAAPTAPDATAAASPVSPAPAAPAEVTQIYDGKWSVHTICEAFQGLPEFEHNYEITVKDGAIYGEDGPKGDAGSGILTGRIPPNGQFRATYIGKAGTTRKLTADAAVGSPVTYAMTGRVYDESGSASQTTVRPCSVKLIQDLPAPATEPGVRK
jgi:serine/threonine protein kinase